MDISLYLDAVEDLAHAMSGAERLERLRTYAAIQTLIGEVRSYAKEHPEDYPVAVTNMGSYFAEMQTPLATLAGLEELSQPYDQNLTWVLQGVEKLRSVHCFNVVRKFPDNP
jgi:hypothetical protein